MARGEGGRGSRKAWLAVSVLVLMAAGSLGLTSCACAIGVRGSIGYLRDTSTMLDGTVKNLVPEKTEYWFEYGLTDQYGHSFPHRFISIGPAGGATVTQWVFGLEEATTYHFRLCAQGPNDVAILGGPVCSYDATFTTTSGTDSVSGYGLVVDGPGPNGPPVGALLNLRADADGSDLFGWLLVLPGTSTNPNAPDDSLVIKCMRIDGNRATIGTRILPVEDDHPGPQYELLIFVEDNGATGDRLSQRVVADAGTCPAATDADFVDVVVDGQPVPPVVTSGGFAVHDHPA